MFNAQFVKCIYSKYTKRLKKQVKALLSQLIKDLVYFLLAINIPI